MAALQDAARIERVAQAVADEVDGQHGEEDRARRGTAPSAARCRGSPWRRTARGPRSGCRAGSPGPGRTASTSAMIAAATSMVPATITGPSALGRMWRTTWRTLEAPSARAASTNSFSRSDRNCARTSRATGIQRRPPITSDDHDEDAALGPDSVLQLLAEQVDDQQQQRQLRQRQEQVGRATSGRHRRCRATCRRWRRPARRRSTATTIGAEPDGERDAPAIEHARQQVLAEIVGAERMRPGRALRAWRRSRSR